MKRASEKSTKRPSASTEDQPSAEFKDQYLFLLEFFVRSVSGERLSMLNRMFCVPTSICFQFLDFRKNDGIEVTPVDRAFEPQMGMIDDLLEYFYSGRSVMFALDRYIVTHKIVDFVITIFVRKKMPKEIKPDIPVGVGRIDLSNHFAALRKEMLQGWHENMPPPKVFEGEVMLLHENNPVGSVDIYVSMSTFGQAIITEFEVPLTDKAAPSYVFKPDENGEENLAYDCRIVGTDTGYTYDSEERLSASGVADSFPCAPCGRGSGAESKNPVEHNLLKSPPMANFRNPERQINGKPVVLKVSGLMDVGDKRKKRPTVTVASESDATHPGDSGDPNHDVFILRIGKKGLVGPEEKSDIQLELRTPKGPDRRPPIRWETREMQTESESSGKKKGKKK